MRPTYARATWLFLRLLGLTYLLAFWSLHTQILGLIGQGGILPAVEYMDRAREFFVANHAGVDRFRQLPTLCWLGASDTFLRGLSLGGIVLAALLIAGILPAVVVPLLWVDYLSLSVAPASSSATSGTRCCSRPACSRWRWRRGWCASVRAHRSARLSLASG